MLEEHNCRWFIIKAFQIVLYFREILLIKTSFSAEEKVVEITRISLLPFRNEIMVISTTFSLAEMEIFINRISRKYNTNSDQHTTSWKLVSRVNLGILVILYIKLGVFIGPESIYEV